jgi:GT2 family glycosyltransferase
MGNPMVFYGRWVAIHPFLSYTAFRFTEEIAMILCIILHYGSEKDTIECIKSIKPSVDIVVADNDPLQTFQYSGVKIFRTGGSLGFAAANNLAVKKCRNSTHTFILLLNNDTIVQNFAIHLMRTTFYDPKVGACGPCLISNDKIWACGGKINKIRLSIGGLKKIHQNTVYEVDYLPGAAILCRLDVWDSVGGLPEKYFLCFEEAEFAMRIKQLGFDVVVNPGATIIHKVGLSSDKQPMYIYNEIRNRMKFGNFIYGPVGYLLGAFFGIFQGHVVVWFHAVFDELNGVPLNAEVLRKI